MHYVVFRKVSQHAEHVNKLASHKTDGVWLPEERLAAAGKCLVAVAEQLFCHMLFNPPELITFLTSLLPNGMNLTKEDDRSSRPSTR